jgi:hypothetical protein
MNRRHFLSLSAGLMVCLALLGCGGGATVAQKGPDKAKAGEHDHDHAGGKEPHDHSGWWCNEHGIPEEVCSMCSPKVAAEFQKKGDWCKEHDRADSQCFKCHPEHQAKFAALYKARYDKDPPAPTE